MITLTALGNGSATNGSFAFTSLADGDVLDRTTTSFRVQFGSSHYVDITGYGFTYTYDEVFEAYTANTGTVTGYRIHEGSYQYDVAGIEEPVSSLNDEAAVQLMVERLFQANNIVSGDSGDDYILGREGSDTIITGEGNDHLDGGAGNDDLNAGDGHDSIIGGTGNDYIVAGEGDDNVEIGDGDNIVYLGGGDDILITHGHGNNFVDGAAGHDSITTGDGNDIIRGGSGHDTILAGNGNNTIHGGDGYDDIIAGDGDDIIHGGDFSDFILAGLGDDTVYGDDGDDTAYLSEGDNIFYGGAGDDYASAASGTIHYEATSGGANFMYGEDGNDWLEGGSGVDVLIGGAGNDGLVGGAGNDILTSDEGSDWIHGGDGDDTIYAGAGTDELYGGDGADTFIYENQSEIGDIYRDFNGTSVDEGDRFVFQGVNFQDLPEGYLDDKYFNLGTATNGLHKFTYHSGALWFDFDGYGGAFVGSNETLVGQIINGHQVSNSDIYITRIQEGTDGDDTMYGGRYTDHFIATEGNDTYTGYEDADEYIYNDASYGGDFITDFNVIHGDVIHVKSENFNNLEVGTLSADHFVMNETGLAEDADDYFIFDNVEQRLYYDADGSGDQARVTIASFQNLDEYSWVSNDTILVIA